MKKNISPHYDKMNTSQIVRSKEEEEYAKSWAFRLNELEIDERILSYRHWVIKNEKNRELNRLFPILSHFDTIFIKDNDKRIDETIDKHVGMMISNNLRWFGRYRKIEFCHMGEDSMYRFAIKMRNEQSSQTFFYSVLDDENNISYFIKKSAEMKDGEHGVDPLERQLGEELYITRVFLNLDYTHDFTKQGIEELVEKAKKNNNLSLYLEMPESCVDRIIKREGIKNEQV